jgi:SynChlorMet cassette radical SAM/SPASM protein ScmE
MRTPRKVHVDITSRCNLRCRYCYFFDNLALEYRDLPTEEWLTFFEEMGRCAVMNVCMAGGEPFIREDLPLLLGGLAKNGLRFSILSNGGLVDDRIAALIAGTGRCDDVQISIDGSRPETHDAMRGRGSFDAAVRGVRTLKRAGVHVSVRVTVHRANVRDLDDVARLLLEDLGLDGFSTNSAGCFGSCQKNEGDVRLTVADHQVAMEALVGLSERYPGRVTAAAGPLANAKMWTRMKAARAAGDEAFPNGGRLTACGCPLTEITVRSDGAYVPCSMLSHMELGRINHDALVDIWQRAPALVQIRRRREIPLSGFAFCAGCEYMPYCTGNCPGTAYAHTGQVDHPSPDGCLRRFLAEGGRL